MQLQFRRLNQLFTIPTLQLLLFKVNGFFLLNVTAFYLCRVCRVLTSCPFLSYSYLACYPVMRFTIRHVYKFESWTRSIFGVEKYRKKIQNIYYTALWKKSIHSLDLARAKGLHFIVAEHSTSHIQICHSDILYSDLRLQWFLYSSITSITMNIPLSRTSEQTLHCQKWLECMTYHNCGLRRSIYGSLI